MTGRALALIAATVGVVLAACSGLVGALFTGGSSAGCYTTPGGTLPTAAPTPPGGGFTGTGRWTAEQVGNAAAIVAVGVTRAVPPRGWVIAVATAMQESSLINTPGGDRDSVGLFQQRPSQGWGSPAQLLDPRYAAGKFYDKLLTIRGWQAMPLTEAAQSVQISAFPDAYAKWEPDAIALVRAVLSPDGGPVSKDIEQAMANPFCLTDGGDGQLGGDGATLPDGFTLPPGTPPPVVTAIGWALGQLGTPYAFGGDCTAAHSGDPALQCDCSSLVQQAYRASGIQLPRKTDDQVQAGRPVLDLGDLRPGDLLFIPGSDGTMADPGHVGLYLGRGLLVQAPHTGDVVKISKLSSWHDQLAAVRRIVG
jgi:hypothetical protein